jgi:hypothetical protein
MTKRRAVVSTIAVAITLSLIGTLAESRAANLEDVFAQDLDVSLDRALADVRARAHEWRPDARLHQVRMNFRESGEVRWRFLWLSDSNAATLRLFSNSRSFRQTGRDPKSKDKPTLDPSKTIGFNRLGQLLEEKGMNLSAVKIEQVDTIQLGYEGWRDPAGFYYYVFLTTGKQQYILAATGENRQ